MGKIKEKIYELSELVYQIMDAGATDEKIDEYVASQITPEEYEFYHAHRDLIFDTLTESYTQVMKDLMVSDQDDDYIIPLLRNSFLPLQESCCGGGKKRPTKLPTIKPSRRPSKPTK